MLNAFMNGLGTERSMLVRSDEDAKVKGTVREA